MRWARTDINAERDIDGPSAVGGAALLAGEANGFAADFTYATDAKRVAVKASNVVTEYALDSFFGNASTSPKLVYDVTGALVWSPHNMCIQSENFAVTWAALGTPVVTAHTIQDDDPASVEAVQNSNIPTIIGETYTATLWVVKDAVTSRFPAVALLGSSLSRVVHLNTSTGATANETVTMSGSTSVVDGGTYWIWSVTGVTDGVATSLRIHPAKGTVIGVNNVAAVGTITVDKVQFNRGTTPTAYLTTTTTARYGLALDYDPVTHAAKGLACDYASTNLLLNSTTLSTQSVTVTPSITHTLSFSGTGTITLSGASTAGPLVGTGANNRVSLLFPTNTSSLTLTVTGTVSKAQLEVGLLTSWIPTFGATQLRTADKYSLTPAQINYSASAGSWWAEVTQLSGGATTYARIVGFTAGQAAPLSSPPNKFSLYDGAILDKALTWAYGSNIRIASAFASGDRAVTGNGAAVATDAGSTVSLLAPGASINLGNDPVGGASGIQGYIRKIFYVPRRMTNGELVSKTT